jgi:hypothetical protein
MPSTCTHHFPSSLHTTISHGTPKTEPQMLSFGFLAQTPIPSFALVNVQPPYCQHAISLHPPPPIITTHHHFTWHI